MKLSIFTMFRNTLMAFIVMSLALALTPGSAAAGAQVFRFSFKGKGAEAGMTTCPFQPQANVVCTDTFIFVSEQVFKEDGTEYPSTTVFLDQYSYKFDRKGNFIPVSERYGIAEAALLVDQKLTSASVSATIPLSVCTVDSRGNYACTYDETVSVSGSWTGTGDLVRVNDNYHAVSKGFTLNGHYRGIFRDAAAVIQVDGNSTGTQFFADIFDVSNGSTYVCHGAC